jgi:hypothetical protein
MDALNRKRAEEMMLRVFQKRPELFLASNLPYEARFFMCAHYGNNFGQMIASNPKVRLFKINMSDELRQRASGLSGISDG